MAEESAQLGLFAREAISVSPTLDSQSDTETYVRELASVGFSDARLLRAAAIADRCEKASARYWERRANCESFDDRRVLAEKWRNAQIKWRQAIGRVNERLLALEAAERNCRVKTLLKEGYETTLYTT